MKIDKWTVNQFESDQKNYGTKTAIFNLLWLNAAEQLMDIGCKRVNTEDPKQYNKDKQTRKRR